ncbi:MAG: protein-glutamate O-methyltransferase CheR [Anaerolineales bacterium]|nr:protein-glutamate O-methyltransferase CheR [Anaerolineales bacterium]
MENLEYNFVKKNILALTGVDLSGYKSQQMQRRLQTYLQRSNHSTWQSFFAAIRRDSTAVNKLRDYLTINVSSFFRDSEKFDYLRDNILPDLLNNRQTLRIWSAGCSRGYEPYSLAMMLAELSGSHRQHYILATDIDHSALAWSQAGGPYTADELANMPVALQKRYFNLRNDRYYVTESLRGRITFRHHNLLADPFEQNFDLIVCRNVVIYFTTEVKDELYHRFSGALRPGGVLFVGGTEIVPKAAEIGLKTVGISFYRRGGTSEIPHTGGLSRPRAFGGRQI